MENREDLCRHPTSHYQAKTGYQHGQEEQDTETTGTWTHRQISGMVEVNHRMVPFQLTLLAQPEKLLSAGDRIGHGVLPVDDDGGLRVGGPNRR